MRTTTFLFVLALAAVFPAGCSVDVAGAPCETDENCPGGQYCGSNKTCALGQKEKDAGGHPLPDGGGPKDAGHHDTGADAATNDAEVSDTGHDAATDAGIDAATDAAMDAGADVGTDGGADAGSDGGYDAGACIDKIDCNGALCCNGHCSPADRGCCTGQDCLGTEYGNVCKDLACQCATEWDCSGPLRICDAAQSPPACIDGCTDAKCGPGKVCCDKACYGGECCADADCTKPGRPTCKAATHTCIDRCGTGLPPCGPAFVCCSDACRRGDCCSDGDCKNNPNGAFCIGYKCSRACTSDANCPGGKCCTVGPYSGSCYTGTCCDDSQCAPPDTCGGGGKPNECGCRPMTPEEFCAAHGKNCNPFTDTDNCGTSRTEDCGTCASCMNCHNNVCAVTHHAASACDQGSVWWYDSCGTREEIKQACDPSQVCAAGACCTPEDDKAFCGRLGKNCDQVTALDNCGVQRTAACGQCDPGWTCGLHTPNVCGCDDDPTACGTRRCGTVTNNCGHVVGCGMCPMNDDCCDGKCVNLQLDRNNCQDCGKTCAWDEVCLSGCTPQKWETQGGAVNLDMTALAHALGAGATWPVVAWVGPNPMVDGGQVTYGAWVHEFNGNGWKQVGDRLTTVTESAQPVVDIQVKSGVPNAIYADTAGRAHLKAYNSVSMSWGEIGPLGYQSPCLMLYSLALAPQDFSVVPSLTLFGMGGCGTGVGYAHWNGNMWWETPAGSGPMKGVITMNGIGNADVVHDSNRSLVAHGEKDNVNGNTYVYVKWFDDTVQPGQWRNLGGALNTGPLPPGGNPGYGLLSFALDPAMKKYVAFTQVVNNVKSIFVKVYDPTWTLVGPDKVSGPNDADSPSLAFIGGVPYLAYVEIENGIGVVNVRRFNGQEWERVGATLNVDGAASAVAPYLVGIDKTPYVAFRQNDGVSASRIYVVRFIPPQ